MNITFATNNILNELKFKSKSILILKKVNIHKKLKKIISFISLHDNG